MTFGACKNMCFAVYAAPQTKHYAETSKHR